jgi:hypothetical protein
MRSAGQRAGAAWKAVGPRIHAGSAAKVGFPLRVAARQANFMESKPQQTGTRLLPGHGEVATTSGSTSF